MAEKKPLCIYSGKLKELQSGDTVPDTAHASLTNNPHSVTAAQAGAIPEAGSSTDNKLAKWDGADGDALQDSSITDTGDYLVLDLQATRSLITSEQPICLGVNVYHDGTNWRRKTAGYANVLIVYGGTGNLQRLTAGSDAKDSIVSWTTVFNASPTLFSAEAVYTPAVTGRDVIVTSAGTFGTASSTERNKMNITPQKSDITKTLMKAEVVEFEYDPAKVQGAEPGKKITGMIAENLDKLGLKDLVWYDDTPDGPIPAGVDYKGMVPYLLQICQTQQAQIDAQQAIIDSLTARIEKMEKTASKNEKT